ncbi:MAG: hypothetical protein V2J25_13215 [Desulfatiglans sp.]|jgi:hypothetical protein|nr:hypothetical protein [Thermodesulfobacteriota bacterium]MEE4353814.1 hypothetical protein [Desulfatiglans sp.]
MKKLSLFLVSALVFGSLLFAACSSHDESGTQDETTETGIDRAVKETSRKILAPLEKADSVKDQQEKRLEEMEDMVNEE